MENKEIEIWKPIEGFEGYYEVSNLGNVRSVFRFVFSKSGSIRRCRGKVLAQTNNIYGYPTVHLSKDGNKKRILVHRLVAKAFIPNPNNLETVNHIDENKTNNNVNNLEWMSDYDNNRYGSHDIQGAKTRSKSIVQLTLDGEYVNSFSSIKDAIKTTGVSNINKVLAFRQYQSGDYCWCYEDEYEECFKR